MEDRTACQTECRKAPSYGSSLVGSNLMPGKMRREEAAHQVGVITCKRRRAGGDIQPIQGGVNRCLHKALNGLFVAVAEEQFTGIPRLWK